MSALPPKADKAPEPSGCPLSAKSGLMHCSKDAVGATRSLSALPPKGGTTRVALAFRLRARAYRWLESEMKGNWLFYMLAWLLVATVAEADAQTRPYPDNPVQIIADSSAGSTPDVALRIVADGLTHVWKQVLVNNRLRCWPRSLAEGNRQCAYKYFSDSCTLRKRLVQQSM